MTVRSVTRLLNDLKRRLFHSKTEKRLLVKTNEELLFFSSLKNTSCGRIVNKTVKDIFPEYLLPVIIVKKTFRNNYRTNVYGIKYV